MPIPANAMVMVCSKVTEAIEARYPIYRVSSTKNDKWTNGKRGQPPFATCATFTCSDDLATDCVLMVNNKRSYTMVANMLERGTVGEYSYLQLLSILVFPDEIEKMCLRQS